MFSDLVEEVRWLFEGSPRGEANRKGEDDKEERKRRAREAYSEKFTSGNTAKTKKAKSLRRQLNVSRDRATVRNTRSTAALKTHVNITEPPKKVVPKVV